MPFQRSELALKMKWIIRAKAKANSSANLKVGPERQNLTVGKLSLELMKKLLN